uniref:Uncharacterized protein n=1 Tax=Magallana gigas TaxID=29159 RepID=K1PKD0_MAGGI
MFSDGLLDFFGLYGRAVIVDPSAEVTCFTDVLLRADYIKHTSGHKWEGMTVLVIDHNPHWTDAERKSKEKFWMHRLKSFRPDGMNKQMDFTKMNVS